MNKSFTEILSIELAKLLLPLLLLKTEKDIEKLMKELGWEVDVPGNIVNDFTDLVTEVGKLLTEINKFPTAATDQDKIKVIKDVGTQVGRVVKEVQKQEVISAFQQLINLATSGINDDDAALFFRRLSDYLVYTYFKDYYKKIFAVKHLLGMAEEVEDAAGQKIKTIQWSRIGKLFTRPIEVFEEVYKWGDAADNSTFDHGKFLKRFEKLIAWWGIAGGIYEQKNTVATHIGNTYDTPPKEIRMPLYQDGIWPDNWRELDLNLSPFTLASDKGVLIYPYFFGGVSISDDLHPNWSFELEGDINTGFTFGLGITPPAELEITGNVDDAWDQQDLKLKLLIERKGAAPKIYLFGSPSATHLSLAKLGMTAFVDKKGTTKKDFGLELRLYELRLEIKKGQGDGFINKILPSSGLYAAADIELGYSLEKGFYFKGSGTFGIDIPLHLTLGTLKIKGLNLGFKPDSDGLGLDLGSTLQLKLGPITGLVENIGLKNLLTFPDSSGAAGFSLSNLEVDFKPPNGIGINIDTGVVTGGGYLYINAEEGRYAGVAGLNIKEKIKLSAFGLIATKLPSGNDGYSFLIFISAEFPPIQLGFGFTLNGVGGLAGIHRTVSVDKLRKGVKSGAYDRLLFPANPVEDALEIIADLRAIFPIQEGRYVFGLMGKIGWGTPTLISVDLGLIIEVPSPVRLAILGVVKAILPDEKGKILKLNVNFLGIIDFGKKCLSFDASIYDSKLLTFSLSGDMALRLKWGNNSNFIMSVGGFHPSFDAPAGLSGMKRLTIKLLKGNNPRLTLSTYFAVTSNTVQFGAKVEVYVKATKRVTAEGFLSFDALFQFNPFYMHILAAAYLAIKWKGKEKFSISANVSLEGPTPWNVNGQAEVKILGFKVKVKVKKRWGKSQNTTLPAVSVAGELAAAMGDIRNWSARLPSSNQQVVQLVELPEDALILHPMGQLTISQKTLPLNLNIQLFGNQEVTDGGQYKVNQLRVGSTVISSSDINYIKEEFAPAHFRKMSETQKLSSASFVKYDSGVTVGGLSNLDGSSHVNKTIEYEVIELGAVPSQGSPVMMAEQVAVLNAMVIGGAAGQSALSFSSAIAPLAPAEITVLEEEYGVVRLSDLQLYTADLYHSSFAEAVDYYTEIVGNNPSERTNLKILPKFEIQS
ncbi:MAG: DUF6603 domain-containing protein [Bacteroidota bacterium]